ncbi:hypothetical protein QA612_08760 [Evansella sp. AB-P1]|uniref:hypothetical protein n=1 Tax=Evansella sp. AB-P1 TaxID=3037653 RepID=UPI00241C31CF|nr:hypothetical protein [Evansella sp. AB-P1]MDG5787585.1 hypothetical protein [Evansella sp. AB-P1]
MKYNMNVHDKETGENRIVWIDDGRIRYSELPTERSGIFHLAGDGFNIVPGKITMDNQVAKAFSQGNGLSYIKRLLLFGFTSFIQLIDLYYESEFDEKLSNSRHQLCYCPIDYIHAVRIPIRRFSDNLARKIKNESIPIVFFTVDKVDELETTHWKNIVGAMFPRRTLLICEPNMNLKEQERDHIIESWKKIVENQRLNSFIGFPPGGQEVSIFLAKRIGLYPRKSTLMNGSDADYLMYSLVNHPVQPLNFPDVIVLKGQVIKAGTKWDIDAIQGQELTTVIPEKFLPIEDINRYEDNKELI